MFLIPPFYLSLLTVLNHYYLHSFIRDFRLIIDADRQLLLLITHNHFFPLLIIPNHWLLVLTVQTNRYEPNWILHLSFTNREFHQAQRDLIMWLNVKHEIPKLKKEWIVAIESNKHFSIAWQDHMVPCLETMPSLFLTHKKI